MADDKEKRDDGDKPSVPMGSNELVIPSDGGSLRPAMTHRDSHSPMTKAE